MADRLFSEFSPVSTEEWWEIIRADLKGKPLEKLGWITPEGFSLFPAVGPEASPPPSGKTNISKSSAKWKIQHVFRAGTVDEVLELLSKPNHFELDAITIVLDTVGKELNQGVFCPHLSDFQKLVAGVKAAGVEVNWKLGAHTLLLCAQLGSDWQGNIGMDPAALFWKPFEVTPDEPSLFSDAASVLKWNEGNAGAKALQVDMQPAMEAGANAAEQIAWALSCWVDYVEGLNKFGISPAQVLSQIQFSFGVGTDFYSEVAKFRAFRRLLDLVLQPYGLAGENVQVSGTGGDAMLSTLDVETNLLRTTTSAMAAILGGCDRVAMPPFDQSFEEPNALGIRMARNIQLILRDESSLDRVLDPTAGSWFVEDYTRKMAEAAWALFLEIEKGGGYFAAWRNGTIQAAIQNDQARIAKGIATRKTVMVGVNQYPGKAMEKQSNPHHAAFQQMLAAEIGPVETEDWFALESEYLKIHAEKVGAVKAAAQAGPETRAKALGDSLSDDCLLFAWPSLLFGTYDPQAPGAFIPSETYAQLRAQLQGKATVALFAYGDLKMRMARLSFARDLFGVLGLSLLESPPTEDFGALLQTNLAQNPDYIVLCAANEDYSDSRWPMIERIKSQSPNTRIIIAGKPEGWEQLATRGASHFIAAGMDVPAFGGILLNEIQNKRA